MTSKLKNKTRLSEADQPNPIPDWPFRERPPGQGNSIRETQMQGTRTGPYLIREKYHIRTANKGRRASTIEIKAEVLRKQREKAKVRRRRYASCKTKSPRCSSCCLLLYCGPLGQVPIVTIKTQRFRHAMQTVGETIDRDYGIGLSTGRVIG